MLTLSTSPKEGIDGGVEKEKTMPQHIPKDITTDASLPTFVWVQIQKFADGDAYENYDYHESDVTLDPRKCLSVREQINTWLMKDDTSAYFVYVGGSSVWLCVGTQRTLLYDCVPASLLSTEPDPFTWWVVKAEAQLEVYKLAVHMYLP